MPLFLSLSIIIIHLLLITIVLGFIIIFPTLTIIIKTFLLIPTGCWLPFGLVDDSMECTSADCVGLEDEYEVGPHADWFRDNSFKWLVTESVNFTLVEPTIPSA
jgi:hypothetical protein